MHDPVAEKNLALFAAMKSQRSGHWDSHWQEIADVAFPFRDFTTMRSPGQKRHNRIFDGTGIWANRQFASSLATFVINPSLKWMGLSMGDDGLDALTDVKQWLWDVRDSMFADFNSTDKNFHLNSHEMLLDCGAFGTGGFFIPENENGAVYLARPLNEIYIRTNSDGVVDTLLRSFTFTARQAIQAYPDAPREVLAEWEKRRSDVNQNTKEMVFVHVIGPNDFSSSRSFLPWRSIHFWEEDKVTVSNRGFHEQPFMVPRISKATTEDYGRGPGAEALPDMKMLQAMAAVVLRAGQKVADPPMALPHDTFLGKPVLKPGGILYYRASAKMQPFPLVSGANPEFGIDMLNSYQRQILRTFYVSAGTNMRPRGKTPASAEEVRKDRQEELKAMTPLVTRLQHEWLAPATTRVYGIKSRRGDFPEPPPVIQGHPININFVSPAVLAQRLVEAEGMARWIESISPIVGTDPEALDNIDGDEFIKHSHHIHDINPSLLRSDDAVNARRKQRQDAEAAAAQAEIAKTNAEAVSSGADAANTLGVTPANLGIL